MTSPAKSRSNATLWIGIGVVVLILAFVAILVSRGDSGSDGDPAGSSGTSTSASPAGGGAITAGEALVPYDATGDDPAVGQTIPSVTGVDFNGDDMTIEPDGQAKVIVFVAHWCPHCQREVPVIKEHLDDNPMPDDVELLTVSTSVQPGAENYPPEEWLAEEGWSAPVLADDEASSVAQAFGLSSFPYFVAVDADGKVIARASGELSTDRFDALVEAARTGEA